MESWKNNKMSPEEVKRIILEGNPDKIKAMAKKGGEATARKKAEDAAWREFKQAQIEEEKAKDKAELEQIGEEKRIGWDDDYRP
jgi:hypothetical protein